MNTTPVSSICHIRPENYPHSAVFDEVVAGLQFGFWELGHSVPIVNEPQPGSLVIGANIVPNIYYPDDCIIFNLEQAGGSWFNDAYKSLLKNHIVWDYSQKNVDALAKMGIDRVVKCGIGYASNLLMIPQNVEKDIDVLFYGSINQHRDRILRELEETGLKVVRLFNCYGAERDQIIARSKIVLNLHYYPQQIFEIVRVSYLLANHCFVVSEDSPEIDKGQYGIPMYPAEDIAKACISWINMPAAMKACAEYSHTRFRSMQQHMYLRYAISATQEIRTSGYQNQDCGTRS